MHDAVGGLSSSSAGTEFLKPGQINGSAKRDAYGGIWCELAVGTLEPDGDDRGARFECKHCDTGLATLEFSVERTGALGEEGNRVALREQLLLLIECCKRGAPRFALHRHRADGLEEPAAERSPAAAALDEIRFHEEPCRARCRDRHDDRVKRRKMICGQNGATRERHMLAARDFRAVNGFERGGQNGPPAAIHESAAAIKRSGGRGVVGCWHLLKVAHSAHASEPLRQHLAPSAKIERPTESRQRYFVRRKASSIVLATAAVLALSGCGAPAEVLAQQSQAPTETGDCVSPYPFESSATADLVTVEGEGVDAKPTIPAGTQIEEVERAVVKPGTGEVLQPDDLVNVEYVISNAETGEVLETSRTSTQDFRTAKLDSANSIFAMPLVCAPGGSEAVLTVPAAATQSGFPWVVYVKAAEKLPLIATGEAIADVDPAAPKVTLDEEGRPTVVIPDGEPPAETTVTVLKKGDGRVVADGDEVIFEYHLMTWDDTEPRQTTYTDFTPLTANTSGLVPGFTKALVGQTIGSQVVVVVKPEDGYTTPGNESHELYDQTLVFVIDILAANPPFEAAE